MDSATIITIILLVISVGLLVSAIWRALTELAEAPPETQDDFHASDERWGYLRDLRDGD